MSEDCISIVAKAAGLDQDEAAEILAAVQDEWKRLKAEADIDTAERMLDRFAAGMAEEMKAQAAHEQRQSARNIVLRDKWDKRLAELAEDGITRPDKAIETMLLGTHRGARSGRVSVSSRKMDLELRWAGKVIAGIEAERPHLLKLIHDKEFQADLIREMFSVDGETRATANKDAQFLAKLLADVSDEARLRANRAGARIEHLKGWVPQRHDTAKLLRAGREPWKKFLLEDGRLDLARTFGDMPADRIPEVLDNIFVTLVNGRPVRDAASRGSFAGFRPGNLADALSRKHRVLHFSNADAWIQYADAFGLGGPVDGVLGHLRSLARDVASMESMGTSPRAFLERYLQHAEKALWERTDVDDATKAAWARKLPRSLEQPTSHLAMAFKVVTGEADHPANLSFARIASAARAWMSLSKLGMAAISSITDLATAATAFRRQGRSPFHAYTTMLDGLFRGKLPKEQREIAHLLGVGFDGLIGDIHARFLAEDRVYGRMAQAQQVFFKLSGLTDWTERHRATFALMSSAHMAEQSGRAWAELDPRYRHTLETHGIGEAQWSLIGAMEKRVPGDERGGRYVIPEAARMLPDKALDSHIEGELAKARTFLEQRHGEAAQTAARKLRQRYDRVSVETRLEDNLRRYFAGPKDKTLSPVALADALQGDIRNVPDQFRAQLATFGIVEGNWNDMRHLVRGGQVNVSRVRDLRPGIAARMAEAHVADVEARTRGRLAGKVDADLTKRRQRLRDQSRQDLEDKLAAFFVDETDYAVLRPDDRTRVTQTWGQQPGTISGEAARFIMQFKSFPVAFTQRVIGSGLHGGPGGKADVGGLVQVIVGSTVLGYMAMTCKDIAKGRKPRDPSKPATWTAAFMQGGGAGIYGDFLLGKYSRFGKGPIDTVLGPAIGTASDVARIAINAGQGEFDGGDALYTAMNNTPYVNLWYTRAALDWLILYHLQEAASPGYLRRMERRMKKQYNQEMIVPPSQYIRWGGGYR